MPYVVCLFADMNIGHQRQLFAADDKWQQSEVTGAFDLPCQFALAAGAVPCLAAGFDFARFADVPFQCLEIFIVKTLAFGAVLGVAVAPHPSLLETA